MSTVPVTLSRRRSLTWVQILGYVVLAFAAFAVVLAFIDGPRTFTQVIVIGFSNGALYALIALGYTMVYGIIELINFAHGDLFMLGSVVAAIFLEERLHQIVVLCQGMDAVGSCRGGGDGAVRSIQRHDREAGLSPST